MTDLVPEQIQDMPWATHDDLMDAIEDVEMYGMCWAELKDVDGDLRMKRMKRILHPEAEHEEAR